jgi:hypothetical protein
VQLLVREGDVELFSEIELIQIMLRILLCSFLLRPLAAEAAAVAFAAVLIIEEPKLFAETFGEERPKQC